MIAKGVLQWLLIGGGLGDLSGSALAFAWRVNGLAVVLAESGIFLLLGALGMRLLALRAMRRAVLEAGETGP